MPGLGIKGKLCVARCFCLIYDYNVVVDRLYAATPVCISFLLLSFPNICSISSCLQQDINPWFQFGHEGFTTPPATAHKGSCTYSPDQILCPIPGGCTSRVPRVPLGGADFRGTFTFTLLLR